MDNQEQTLVIAALFHDIGKFYQRASDSFSNNEELQAANVHIENVDTLVPISKSGRPGYQHALWTYAFFEKYKKYLPNYINKNIISSLSAKHHRPSKGNPLEQIISMADKWSSTNERRFEDHAADEKDDRNHPFYKGRQPFKRIPLHSIFNVINIKGQYGDGNHYFPLKALNVIHEPSIIPKTGEGYSQELYKVHWDLFEKEFVDLCKSISHKSSFPNFVKTLLSLLKKYLWCIPSTTMDMPYSSLYEHSKITAGISHCLYRHYQVEKEAFHEVDTYNGNYGSQMQLSKDSDPILMCCIDLSGVQKYLYNISSKKAALSLKGRSFSMQLLIDAIVNEILYDDEIKMTSCNIIYSSGGKSYILLPNTNKIKNRLKKLKEQLAHKMWKEYKGKLFAAMGWVSFGYYLQIDKTGYKLLLKSNDLKVEKTELGDLWKAVSEKAAKDKRRRFFSLFNQTENFNQFFAPIDVIKGKQCQVTGEFGRGREIEEGIFVNHSVEQQIQLGKKFTKFNTLSESYNNQAPKNSFSPASLKTNYSINDQVDIHDITYSVNDTSSYPYIFYAGNFQPTIDNDERRTFEQLCLLDGEEAKIGNRVTTKLATLRMDVDGLGDVFIHGFNTKDNSTTDNKSFSAYATLSMLLDTFFTGYINHIWAQDYKENVSILYAGGDDIFAIGRWDKIINFANSLREEFRRFVGRDDLSISAGIAITGPKYPIAKAAELAGEAEKTAKKNIRFEKDVEIKKDSICIFGTTIGWNRDWNYVLKLKNDLVSLIQRKLLSKSILHRIQLYRIQRDDFELTHIGKKYFRYKWHAAYNFGRAKEKIKDSRAKEMLQSISDNIMHCKEYNSHDYLNILSLACKWAEFELKDIEKLN